LHTVTNLVGVPLSAHRQMSLSPFHTQTAAPHPGLHSPSAITLHLRPISGAIKAP
ncbi:hypothetical protein M9458_051942, partial [Cirrhinus mrigala]